MFGIISEDDKNLLKRVKEANIDEVRLWRIPNIVIPSFIIVFTILIYIFLRPSWTLRGCLNFLVNGSIPLIAVNQIASIGIYIFKFNKAKESELGIETTRRIRTVLFYQVLGLLFSCILLYAYQTINHPFGSICEIIVVALVSGLLVWFSSSVAHKIFILQDDFIKLAYDKDIRDNVQKVTPQSWDDYESD